jgi:hypothetical protein
MPEEVKLHPLLITKEYLETGVWDLPHVALPNDEFLLTWVNYDEAITYLSRDEYQDLETSKPNWQQDSFDNVRQTRYFHHYQQQNESGKLEWLAFLNDEDTISSSKVLLWFELSRLFPEGYHVAIPDRACGVVVSNTCSDDALQQVIQLIEQMYADASIPMSAKLYPSMDFQLPSNWAMPKADDSTSAAILNLFA